ncbi:hypothetical protein [Bacillus thuringiensis]|uniref:hypothetical protein n=1 Tax=Bacillus thuringiensis TaxID=1428 RepID=UPI0021D68E18|nr:hypothetical protein [Bacillus thuringiensis]MCU7667090.1 hypothetical protein [Bacillus thuringiensis]
MNNKNIGEKGSIGLIVLLVLFFLTTAGLTVMIMSGTNLKTAYNTYWKAKSNSLVDFAVKEYKGRINELFLQNDVYDTKDINLSKINNAPFEIKENGLKKANVDFFGVKFDSMNFKTTYGYLDELTGNPSENNAILYQNPPVDDNFTIKDYKNIIGDELGITSVESIFNNAYNSNEFFISKAVFNSDGELDEIRLLNYFPLIEEKTDGPLFVVTREELEKQIKTKTGVENALENVRLNDDINIGVSWDSNVNSPVINMAITVKKDGKVYLFNSVPIVDSKFYYYDTITEADQIQKAIIKSSYDMNVNAVVSTVAITVQRLDGKTHLNNYLFYTPSDDKVDLTSKVRLDFGTSVRTFSISTYWNDVLKSTEMLLFTVEDVNSSGKSNGKISVYKMSVGIDSEFKKETDIDISSTGVDYVHALGSAVFWNKELNDGYVHLVFASPDAKNPKGEHKVFHLETNIINFDSPIIKPISLAGAGLRNVGRIGVAGMYNEFGELMIVMEKTVVKKEKIVLESLKEQNIVITSFEDNNSGREGAKTKIRIKPEIEAVTILDSNIRFVKSFVLKDLSIE